MNPSVENLGTLIYSHRHGTSIINLGLTLTIGGLACLILDTKDPILETIVGPCMFLLGLIPLIIGTRKRKWPVNFYEHGIIERDFVMLYADVTSLQAGIGLIALSNILFLTANHFKFKAESQGATGQI